MYIYTVKNAIQIKFVRTIKGAEFAVGRSPFVRNPPRSLNIRALNEARKYMCAQTLSGQTEPFLCNNRDGLIADNLRRGCGKDLSGGYSHSTMKSNNSHSEYTNSTTNQLRIH